VGRQRKQLQPSDLLRVELYLRKRMKDVWAHKDPFGETHPAFGKLDYMKAELNDLVRKHNHFRVEGKPDAAQTAALALTEFCEKWFAPLDWTRLKDTLRRNKSNKKNGRPAMLGISEGLAERIRNMVVWDADCDTQEALLKKYLHPHYDRLREVGLAAERVVVQEHLADWEPLKVSGLYWLWLKQQDGIEGSEKLDSKSPHYHRKQMALNDYEPKAFERLLADFNEQPNKWCGYAKRKWPELKETTK